VSDDASSPIPAAGQPPPPRGRSLKVQDAPGLAQSFEPVLHIHPGWAAGRFVAGFDVMAQPGADWFFEMRGRSGEYAAGPMVTWRKGKLYAGIGDAPPLADIPPDEWFRVAITATTGAGSYDVELTRQDGSRREFRKLPCMPSWKDAGYLLFSGQGSEKAAFFIDNLRLEPVAE